MLRFLLVCVVLWTAPALAQGGGVEVQQAWARAPAGAGSSAAVYLTVIDHGAADALTGITTPAAGMAMLHESYVENGVSKMRMLDGLPIAADAVVTLKPGSMHIMLTELTQKLRPGAAFPLTLSFAKAAPVTVTVKVLAAGASGPVMPGMKP